MKSSKERATITVEEAARILGVGRATAYEAVRTGRLKSIRVSRRRIVVLREPLERLLRGEEAGT
jgi:excisionase family DNA binding protein